LNLLYFKWGKFNSKFEQLESRTVSWNGLCSSFEIPLYYVYPFIIVTCSMVHGTNKTGSSSDVWIYWHFCYTLTLNYTYIQAIQSYRWFTHFQFTFAHPLRFSLSSRRLLATDLTQKQYKSH
jgi:hypothetical protein